MWSHKGLRIGFVLLLLGCSSSPDEARSQDQNQTSGVLRQVQTVDLAGVEGRFDHFATDPKGERLFLAALGNNTMEVFHTVEGKRVATVKGLHKPTGVAFASETGRVVVANGDDGTVRFYDGSTLNPVGEVRGLDDADNVRYD